MARLDYCVPSTVGSNHLSWLNQRVKIHSHQNYNAAFVWKVLSHQNSYRVFIHFANHVCRRLLRVTLTTTGISTVRCVVVLYIYQKMVWMDFKATFISSRRTSKLVSLINQLCVIYVIQRRLYRDASSVMRTCARTVPNHILK